MKHLNKKNNNRYVITAVAPTIFTLAIMTVASIMATSVAATATTTEEATTTTPPPAGLELSPQPIYQEVSRQVGENLINDTHVETTFTANGTLTLPNTTETIDTTSTGTILIAFMEGTAIGEQVITTSEGESAEAKFFGIARFNMEESTGRGIVIALVHSDSTGRLAPLNGMILAGDVEFDPEGTSLTTLWEWQSGIPLPTATTPEELPPLMNDTTATTTTNATTTTTTDAADTNAATTAAPAPEQGEGAEGEEQQQQTTIAPNPLFE
jgi:hypothetical protein